MAKINLVELSLGLILAVIFAYITLKDLKPNVQLNVSNSSGANPSYSNLNLKLSLAGNNVAINDVYYIQPDMAGFYTCGMQGVGGNQTVRYTWTLKVKASPPVSGVTVFLEINYFDTSSKSWVTPNSFYTKTWSMTLNGNGEASQEFQDCLIPHSVRAMSSVGVKVVKVELPSGEPVNFNANSITLIPQ